MFRSISAGLLLAGLAFVPLATAAPDTYRCVVQSNTGLTSVMQEADTIIINETEQLVRFFQADRDFGATPLSGRSAQFYQNESTVIAIQNNVSPAQVFSIDKENGIAAHSYIIDQGIATTTWKCTLLN